MGINEVSTTKGANSQMTPPSVSVVLPVHNGGDYLQEAIDSILNQTFKDFELLIIDDGSDDGSRDLAEEYSRRDRRIRVISLDRVGLTEALNIGIDSSAAPLIARMDADDKAHPNRLDRQVAYLTQNPDVAVVGSHARMIGPTGKVVGKSTLGPTSLEEYQAQRAEVRVNFLHPTVMFRKHVVQAAGGYSAEYIAGEDYELWNRLADNHQMLTITDSLLDYRVHPNATGTKMMRAQTESWARIRVNIMRQRAGLLPLSESDFMALRRQAGFLKRLNRELGLRSRYAYRRGAAQIASGKPSGLVLLSIAIALHPPTVLTRLKRQILEPLMKKRSLS